MMSAVSSARCSSAARASSRRISSPSSVRRKPPRSSDSARMGGPLPLCCALARRSASRSPAACRAGWLAGGTTNTGPAAVRFPRRMDRASADRWPVNHPAHHDQWRRATGGPARGLSQADRSSVVDQLWVAGHRDVQPAPRPVLPAGASPGSAVLPGTTRLPPAAWVTVTRRAWALGDAGMVTCRTPSA